MKPTNHLRYILKERMLLLQGPFVDKILMQLWECPKTGKREWREIEKMSPEDVEQLNLKK